MLDKADDASIFLVRLADIDFSKNHIAEVRYPTFMAPELIKGETGFTFATDVWAMGIVFYKLVTGRFPFEGD